MKPGSFLGILLELLLDLERPEGLPADARIGRFFRERRYLGAKDRRLLGSLAYAWIRQGLRGEARWNAWACRTGVPAAGEASGREAPLPSLMALAHDGILSWSARDLLVAARQLLPEGSTWIALLERALAPDALGPQDWPSDPMTRLAAELALPEWLAHRLVEERGLEAARSLGALLLEEAPVDLRVNTAKGSRQEAAQAIEAQAGADFTGPTPWSPLGLRLRRRLNLGAFLASRKGWLEVQDEGSQLAVLAAEPPPAGTVIDGCAGAGGKTLAILDLREAAGGAGEIHACDILGDKLDELCRRTALREARNLHIHRIAPEGPLPPGLPVQADLVFLDAPCSGTGTLRRSPDLKRRHGPADVTRFAALQASILRRFAPLVRPGGRLVYTTCSLLREENDAVVDPFLKEQPGFTGIGSPWARSHLSAQVQEGGRLRLDPLATGTDGFFVAILERTS